MSKPPSSTTNITTVTISCHCQTNRINATIPTASLPLKSALCHCHSCRHVTGQMFATFAVIPADVPGEFQHSHSGGGDGDDGTAKVIRYQSSPNITRVSCRVCGASLGNVEYERSSASGVDGEGKGEVLEWEAATGCLCISSDGKDGVVGAVEGDNAKTDLTGKLDRVQLWVEDVQDDGGAVGWINAGKLSGMNRFRRGRDSDMVMDDEVKAMLDSGSATSGGKPSSMSMSTAETKLQVRCHCGNVDFDITRPEPDYNEGTGKFPSFFDTCTSCRTATGFEILSWITVPRRLIMTPATDLQSYLSDSSKVTHYKTSESVDRYFCSRCAASVFYYKHGLDDLDLSLGLLQSHSNREARILDWLEWQKYPQVLSYTEDAVDENLVTSLAQGLKVERGESTVNKT
ncbi:hypothetical protein PV10_01495 [Exophiala mesophila]|uniref:CENP-V/GFA domain-containing protein n=1 Tax=Exophiala mesophila TaxID=212818 RepID=A0A0D1ZT74_EXOME|nr:uncharacterized protein PV10_01495 [Exophiala mesophila]KIV97787.1 hypothetical protein PV10_01495 [Exophiala mesophila]